mgnify:CR=1 FL=1
MKIRYLLIAIAGLTLAGGAFGQTGKTGGKPLLNAVNGSEQVNSLADAVISGAGGTPGVGFDLTGILSMDPIGDPDNIIVDLNIGAGNQMTGVSWDAGIMTVGASWLSEADVTFSDSTGALTDPNAIRLTVGAGEDGPGDMDFTSGGMVLDFSDNMLPNITAGADGILRLEFSDSFDDFPDAADANWRNAAAVALVAGLGIACTNQAACDAAVGGGGGGPALPPPPSVPALNTLGLAALSLLLMLGTFLVLRRRA